MDEKFKNLTAEYKEIQEKIPHRREKWAKETESNIFEYLKKYQKELDLDWYVDINSFQNNHHAVYLSFKSKASGIGTRNRTGERISIKNYIKEPNYLCYSQSVNGKIYIWIRYSYIKDIQPQPTHKKLAYIEPNEIKKDLVDNHVEKFLKEAIEHEKEADKEPIGF